MIVVEFSFDRLTGNRIEVGLKIGRGQTGNRRDRERWQAEERATATTALQAIAAIYQQHAQTMPTEVGVICTTTLDRLNEDLPVE